MTTKRSILFICLFLIVGTSFVYWNADKFGFISFDDHDYVINNYHIFSGITVNSLQWAFTSFHSANWHPLTWLSLMMDYHWYGLKPSGYHLTNLLFHILNALLLFFAVRSLTGTLWRSALVAALFAVHPLHVESVAWISERKDVLSAFFMFISLLFYSSYAGSKQWKYYFATFLFFALGILSKPMIVTFPFVLLLLDFWPLNRFGNAISSEKSSFLQLNKNQIFKAIYEKIPFFILSFISSVLTFLAQKAGSAVVKTDELPVHLRFANSFISYFEYIEKMFWPKNLSFFYPLSVSLPPIKNLVLAVGIILLISVIATFRIKKQPYFLIGWLWFLGTLVPVIGLVQVGAQSLADRYTYIPLIGLFICFAWLLHDFVQRKNMIVKSVAVASCGAILVVLIFLARTQTACWKNDLTLSDNALAISNSNYIAYSTKGRFLFVNGRYDEALNCYRTSLSICSTQITPKFNIGCIFFNEGKYKESLNAFKIAFSQDSNDPLIFVNCGQAYSALGDKQTAISYYTRALSKDTGFSLAYSNLGKVYGELKDYKKSREYLLKAYSINPLDASTCFALGNNCLIGKDVKEAAQWFEKSVSINPGFIPARRYYAAALDSCGNHDLAKQQTIIADSIVAIFGNRGKQ